MGSEDTAEELRRALAERDHAAFASHLAPDVVFHSPLIETQFEGADAVADVMRTVLEGFEEIQPGAHAASDEGHFFAFHGRVGGREVDVVDLIRFDEAGRVADMTVHIRPMAGLAAVAAAIGPPLARKRSRLGALILSILSAPLPLMLSLMDPLVRRFVRLRG